VQNSGFVSEIIVKEPAKVLDPHSTWLFSLAYFMTFTGNFFSLTLALFIFLNLLTNGSSYSGSTIFTRSPFGSGRHNSGDTAEKGGRHLSGQASGTGDDHWHRHHRWIQVLCSRPWWCGFGTGFFKALVWITPIIWTVKWGNIVIGINIVTSLSYFLTGHNSRTNEFISLA